MTTAHAIDLEGRLDGLLLIVDSAALDLAGALDRATAALGAARDDTAGATSELQATVEDAIGALASLAGSSPEETPPDGADSHAMPDALGQDAVTEAHAVLAAAADECVDAQEVHVGAAAELGLEGHALGEEAAGSEQAFADGSDRVDHALDAYRQDLVDGHGQASDSFTSAAARLTGPLTAGLGDLFSELGAATDRALGELSHAAETHGAAWASATTALLAETAQDILRDALRQVEAAIIHAVQYAVELLFVEITAQLVTMAMGTGVTAALAPLIPELIMLKHALHALNWLLDLVS